MQKLLSYPKGFNIIRLIPHAGGIDIWKEYFTHYIKKVPQTLQGVAEKNR